MKVLGLNIHKPELRLTLLTGTFHHPVLEKVDRVRFRDTLGRSQMADFFKQTFNEFLTRDRPDRVAYRLSLEGKSANQIAYLYQPFGILCLLCHERNIPIFEYTANSFSRKKLGHDQDKFETCDTVFGNTHQPWDNNQRYATLAGWVTLT